MTQEPRKRESGTSTCHGISIRKFKRSFEISSFCLIMLAYLNAFIKDGRPLMYLGKLKVDDGKRIILTFVDWD